MFALAGGRGALIKFSLSKLNVCGTKLRLDQLISDRVHYSWVLLFGKYFSKLIWSKFCTCLKLL